MAKTGGAAMRVSSPKRPSMAGRSPLRPTAGSVSPSFRRATLDDRIHAHLRTLIMGGHIRSGERIQVDALASRLGVSRTRVVCALKRLAREGAVDWLFRRGFYVRLLNRREMAELFAVREMLEGLSARLAAQRITSAEVARLTAMFRGVSGEPTPELVRRYLQSDRTFHRRLAAEETIFRGQAWCCSIPTCT